VSAEIIDGNKIAQDIRDEVAQGVSKLQAQHGIVTGLAAFLIGDDPASAIYVRNKGRACQEVGIYSETFKLPADITQNELIERIQATNRDDRFHGILVQLPLPSHIDEHAIILSIDPDKDADSLHPLNLGRLVEGKPTFVPGTPAGIQELLKRTGHKTDGKHVVVCGRSNIVGKPMAILMMQKAEWANSTVTVCHTGTKDLATFTRSADILIVAIGKANAITADMVGEDTIVIDVGMNRVTDDTRKRGYRLVGDVDFEEVSKKATAITPVPGGVGPMTVAMLMMNTLKAAQSKIIVAQELH
jgi:methylenetetrahydrofolate dehydrogenase (NADP+)/methenyltetrahydrofolate cyclohydrolase